MFNFEKIFNLPKTPDKLKSPHHFNIHGETAAAENRPQRNEDAILINKEKGVFGIFDGMGGHAAGDKASQEVKIYIAEALQKLPNNFTPQLIQKELEKAFYGANNKLLQLAQENPDLVGMGTTASVVKIWESAQGDRKAVIANIGDSRVYVYRADKKLEQITLDDNIISYSINNEQRARDVQQKLNNVVDFNFNNLSIQEKEWFNKRHQISQALGIDNSVEPRLYIVPIHAEEKIVITSDGIHDNLTDEEIAQALCVALDNEIAVKDLIRSAKKRSREQNLRARSDDMSAIIFEISTLEHNKKIETPPLTEQYEDQEWPKGKLVFVQRSSGKIEPGWEVFGVNPKTGDIIVHKSDTDGETIIRKQIPSAILRNLNTPERRTYIYSAESFPELFQAIEHLGGLQGSERFYEAEELKNIINLIREEKVGLQALTRTEGLRDRVKYLLDRELLNKNKNSLLK